MIYNCGGNTERNQGPPEQTGFRSDVEADEPLVSLHYPESADIAVARRLAAEQIRVTGAHTNVFARTDNLDMDDEVWDEDADPTYWPAVILKCMFKPQPTETELKRWGIDTSNKTEVIFAMSDLVAHFPNRLLRTGDVLELPYNLPVDNLDPGFYRIIKVTPSGNYKYSWLYLTVTVDILSADQTVRVKPDLLDTNINDNGSRFNGGI